MKKIIFINQDSGYLMIDIINAYAETGYSCVILTGRLVVRNRLLHSTVNIDTIIKYNRATTFMRLLTWSIGFFQIWLKVGLKYRKDDLFIVSNPPFAPLLPLLVKNSFKLLIFDIYPDILSELGYLKKDSLVMGWWSKGNIKVFNKAEKIFTISKSMKQILNSYAGNNIIEVVTIWTDNIFLKPIKADENPFLLRHNLSGKFIIMYSGNIGLSSDVEILIDIAAKIDMDDIIFVIIGDGAKKEKIRIKAEKLNLKNLILLPWQPASELPFSFSAANLAVISLGTNVSKLAVPSKLYNFLSVGAPLLCLTSKGSEIETLVAEYECGRCFEPNNISGIVNYILDVAENRNLHKLLINNSLKASTDFTMTNITKFLT